MTITTSYIKVVKYKRQYHLKMPHMSSVITTYGCYAKKINSKNQFIYAF